MSIARVFLFFCFFLFLHHSSSFPRVLLRVCCHVGKVALNLLLKLPIWIGVLVTLTDSFLFLSLNARRTQQLENFFSVLIGVMSASFLYTLLLSKPSFSCIARGLFIPSMPDTREKALDLLSLIGCILMPHNVFLHSALALTRKVKRKKVDKVIEANYYFSLEAALTLGVSFL